jgi:hypothetical protein
MVRCLGLVALAPVLAACFGSGGPDVATPVPENATRLVLEMHDTPAASGLRAGLTWTATVNDPARLGPLIREIDSLPAFPGGGSGGMNCPNDDGSYYRLDFTVPGSRDVVVYLRRTGCRELSNQLSGPALWWAFKAPKLYAGLDALGPSARPAP